MAGGCASTPATTPTRTRSTRTRTSAPRSCCSPPRTSSDARVSNGGSPPARASSSLRRAQPLVRAYCAEHGVPYTEAGLLESYAIVVRHLNRVGLGDRDPFACPFVVVNRTG